MNVVFEELRIVNTEAVSSGLSNDRKGGDHNIPIYDDWVRRLQVSVYLRSGELSEYKRAKADVLLDKLELLQHALSHRNAALARQLAMDVDRAYGRLRKAFLSGWHDGKI